MHRIVDITGNKYNMLEVLSFDHCENRRSYWKCRCDCGNIVILRKGHFAFKGSKQKSCGCWHRKESSIRMTERHRKARELQNDQNRESLL
jgi:hypothetical protein